MEYTSPENLEFLKNNEPYVLHDFTPKRSSQKKKMLLESGDERFFLKFVGDIANDVAKLYINIKNDKNIKDYFPDLAAEEKGWLIYEYIEGKDFYKFFLRKLFSISFTEVLELFFLQGQFLASFHKAFFKEFVKANEYLEPYLSKLNLKITDDDLTNDVPLVKMYNGYTMRNVLLTGPKKILCLDIDGAYHPKLPQYMLPYQDICFSILNILSLSTFPVLPYSRIKNGLNEFLRGYFHENKNIQYSKILLQTFITFQNYGLTGLSIKKIYPSKKHKIFRTKISTAIKNNKFNFLPESL